MRQTSDLSYSVIKDFNDANANVFGAEIYPIEAPIKATYPFCVYLVEKRPMYSKAGAFEYEVQIRFVNDTYLNLCDITDSFLEFMKGYPEFFYQGTESEVIPNDSKKYATTSTFQLYKNT